MLCWMVSSTEKRVQFIKYIIMWPPFNKYWVQTALIFLIALVLPGLSISLVVLFFSTLLPYESLCLNCDRRRACQELHVISSISTTAGSFNLMFHFTDSRYSLIADLFQRCLATTYLTGSVQIDCSDFTSTLYFIQVYPGKPAVFKLTVQPSSVPGRRPVPTTTERELIQIKEAQPVVTEYSSVKSLNSTTVLTPKWLKITNTVIQGICTLMLILIAALTCIGRWVDLFRLLVKVATFQMSSTIHWHPSSSFATDRF